MIKKILLCTDGSDQSFVAAGLTADLACRLGASVNLIHVLDPVITAEPAAFVPEAMLSADITLKYAQKAQEAILKRTSRIMEEAGIACRSHAEFGHPVESIHQIAEQEKIDSIVIGSRGLGTWSTLLLGSVSEGVARNAGCPVLIVRGEPKGFRHVLMGSDGSEGAVRAIRARLRTRVPSGSKPATDSPFANV